jgi:peptidyl-dipeptidase Dcp
MAENLYGLHFRERHDIPVYHADVGTFELLDEDNEPLGLIYGDFLARPNKQGGSWCDDMLPPNRELGQKPVVVCATNLVKPPPGEPAFLSTQDVFAIFHEFGHALHTSLSVQRFYSQNGFSMPMDAVEFPSQFHERLALEPGVVDHYARHYQTGEPLAQDALSRLRERIKFDKAYETTEYLASALLDLEWHSLPADAPRQASDHFEAAALSKNSVEIAEVPLVYKSTYLPTFGAAVTRLTSRP